MSDARIIPNPSLPSPACATCRFFAPHEGIAGVPTFHGACRRYPRAVTVSRADWCGEWTAR